jgi:hypothetical protein
VTYFRDRYQGVGAIAADEPAPRSAPAPTVRGHATRDYRATPESRRVVRQALGMAALVPAISTSTPLYPSSPTGPLSEVEVRSIMGPRPTVSIGSGVGSQTITGIMTAPPPPPPVAGLSPIAPIVTAPPPPPSGGTSPVAPPVAPSTAAPPSMIGPSMPDGTSAPAPSSSSFLLPLLLVGGGAAAYFLWKRKKRTP